MAHSVHLERVPTLTPVDSGNPWTFFPADYLSPLFCGKEIAVLRTPSEIDGDGSEACSSKPDDTSPLWTAVKIATYILSVGILPLLAFLLTVAVRCYKGFHYTVEVQAPHSPLPEAQSVTALQSPRETEQSAVISAPDTLDSPLPTNIPDSLRDEEHLEENSVAIASPIAPVPVAAPISSGWKLKDGSELKGAKIMTSEAIRPGDNTYQYLVVKSPQTQKYHKVILCDAGYGHAVDEPIQSYEDLSDGDKIYVSGSEKGLAIRVEEAHNGDATYTISFNNDLYPIDYRDPSGEKVLFAIKNGGLVNADVVNRLKEALERNSGRHNLRRKLFAILPNLFPSHIEPGSKITPFQRKGKLYDYTEGAIAGLEISEEPHEEDGKPHEYLTLNGIKVVLHDRGSVEFRTHFDLKGDEDTVIIKQSNNSSSIEIKVCWGGYAEYSTPTTLSVRPNLWYQRTYTDADGNTCTEKVLITDITDNKLGENEDLRQKLSLVWPPVR